MRTLIASVILAIPAFAADVPWTPAASDLLFSSTRDGNSEVYLLPAGQKEAKNLTNHKAGDNWPGWSPDGARIVFQSNREGNLDIFTMKADGSEQTRLTTDSEPDYLPAWSPDGKTVLFTSWRKEPGEEKREPHLYVMNADGTKQRRLIANSLGTSAGATWSPDGKQIVYSRKAGDKGANLYLADSDGTNEKQLTSFKDSYDGSPAFSPDGQLIAFYFDDGKNSSLAVIKPDGTGHRTVLAEGKNWYPRWSPNGKWLTYCAPAADEKTNIHIFAITVTKDVKPTLLIGGAKRNTESSWRPKP